LDGLMSDSEWPYNLPIWRSAHRAASPDGQAVAEIGSTCEVSMGNPTCGTLRISIGLELERCNPSFIWSDDSRYLAVPWYFYRLGLFRRQRIVVIDTRERRALASRETAYYYQPESFAAGRLVVTKQPFRSAKRVTWQIPADLAGFKAINVLWTDAVQGDADGR
jgi:hypothetical protein